MKKIALLLIMVGMLCAIPLVAGASYSVGVNEGDEFVWEVKISSMSSLPVGMQDKIKITSISSSTSTFSLSYSSSDGHSNIIVLNKNSGDYSSVPVGMLAKFCLIPVSGYLDPFNRFSGYSASGNKLEYSNSIGFKRIWQFDSRGVCISYSWEDDGEVTYLSELISGGSAVPGYDLPVLLIASTLLIAALSLAIHRKAHRSARA